jgi:hypothetical protein
MAQRKLGIVNQSRKKIITKILGIFGIMNPRFLNSKFKAQRLKLKIKVFEP